MGGGLERRALQGERLLELALGPLAVREAGVHELLDAAEQERGATIVLIVITQRASS